MKFKAIAISIFIIWGIVNAEKALAQLVFPNEIRKSFLSGDSKTLASYFDKNIELILLNKGNVYSKAQAELIMKNFFIKHRPKSFVIESESNDDRSKFAIAFLATRQTSFRVYIAFIAGYKQNLINQMIISEIHNEDN